MLDKMRRMLIWNFHPRMVALRFILIFPLQSQPTAPHCPPQIPSVIWRPPTKMKLQREIFSRHNSGILIFHTNRIVWIRMISISKTPPWEMPIHTLILKATLSSLLPKNFRTLLLLTKIFSRKSWQVDMSWGINWGKPWLMWLIILKKVIFCMSATWELRNLRRDGYRKRGLFWTVLWTMSSGIPRYLALHHILQVSNCFVQVCSHQKARIFGFFPEGSEVLILRDVRWWLYLAEIFGRWVSTVHSTSPTFHLPRARSAIFFHVSVVFGRSILQNTVFSCRLCGLRTPAIIKWILRNVMVTGAAGSPSEMIPFYLAKSCCRLLQTLSCGSLSTPFLGTSFGLV